MRKAATLLLMPNVSVRKICALLRVRLLLRLLLLRPALRLLGVLLLPAAIFRRNA